MTSIYLVADLVVVGLLLAVGWTLIHLLGQSGRVLTRLDALEAAVAANGSDTTPVPPPAFSEPGLPIGTVAPAFALPGLHGEILTLESLCAIGKPVLLVFSDPTCGPCDTLLPDLGRWQRAEAFTVAIISEGTAEANRAKTIEHGLNRVLLQRDREVAEAYKANSAPAAVVVRPDGIVDSALALGPNAIRVLAAQTGGALAPSAQPAAPTVVPLATKSANGSEPAAAPTASSPLRLGDPAPAIELPDLDGNPVRLADFRGHPTFVLFWSLGCGICQQMLPDLKAWDANRPEGAPKLLVVSTGAVAENRAMGLTSTVVLEEGFATGHAFGAKGTPTAVLVDAEGRVASPLAPGAPAVLALVTGQEPTEVRAASNGVVAVAVPAAGDPAPAFELPNLDGVPVRLADFRGHPTMVLFWNPGCGFCQEMVPDLKAWEADRPEGAPNLLVVSTGTAAANWAMGLDAPIVLAQDFAVGRAFGAEGTPSAILVDAEGRIASSLAIGSEDVVALARSEGPGLVAPSSGATSLKPAVGDPAPAVRLPDLTGEQVDLADFRGTPTFLVFWSPECGPCAEMLDGLKTWEANPPEGAPKLLVVSSGDPEQNRATGLQSTIALDQNFSTGHAFGAIGTPSAVLIDAEGRLASPVVAGASPVLELVGAAQDHLMSESA